MQICVPGVGSKCHFPLPGAFVPPCPRGAETPFPLLPERARVQLRAGQSAGMRLPRFVPSLLCRLQKLQPSCAGLGESQLPKRTRAPLNSSLFDHREK